MGVPLQLILGILLALSQCSFAKISTLRHIREAPPPPPAPIQNVTEINNRDLNKIVKDNPKTEAVDSKSKFVNNVHSYEDLPLKLANTVDERQSSLKKNETEDSNEDFKKSSPKLVKDFSKEDNFKGAGVDASKFWSPDFFSKSVFTLPPVPHIEKFPESSDVEVEGTKHPSFQANSELTTPTIHIFDHKFKETVESVEQNIEADDHENDETGSEEKDDKDVDLNVEDLLKKSENGSFEFVKTKTIVNNETVDKNSIHKDVNLEQIKKLDFEEAFNDTKVYVEETTKGETSEHSSIDRVSTSTTTTTTLPLLTTRKSSLLKESLNETSNFHILSNNIDTETNEPIKGGTTSTFPSITKKDKGEVTNIMVTTAVPSSKKPKTDFQSTTTNGPTTIPISLLKINISDQENHVIPLHFGSESTPIQEPSSKRPSIIENTKRTTTIDETNKRNHTVVDTQMTIDITTESDGTTETITTTEIPETTTLFEALKELSDGTTIALPEEGTTIFVIDNTTDSLDATTAISTSTEEGTTILVEMSTTESAYRTSKSLENTTVTEYMLKISERTVENLTKEVQTSTESTARNELDSTTLNDGRKVESDSTDNVIEKAKNTDITTEDEEFTSTTANVDITTLKSFSDTTLINLTTLRILEPSEAATEEKRTVTSTEKVLVEPKTTTEVQTTTQKEKPQPTTTEYAFVHIENAGTNHTTLLPEILSPNLNYSTTIAVDNEANKIRKVILDDASSGAAVDASSSTTTTTAAGTTTITTTTTTTTTTEESVGITTEDGAETLTDSSFTKEGGGNKGKIAAIAISSVGAVCLVLLAGLLYVMKKRQKRLNYGPRCRPVSLDDYSIDNLSVYNSVRRKGGARMSKRSFGNPAFEDPVAPTHPLNFLALAKFSTNFEDIKAEFEEIPQISARTSELPDGCETKNRYANVIPLPETRVFLKFIDGYPNSDYINANYVTGPKNTKGYYIASQGPMQNTVDDFWRMVWEQQAKVILMLTHLVENGLEKCVDYLPESEVVDCSRLFGDFQIILKKQEVKDKYIISTVQLKNMVSNSWREVTHFWYLGWPEKGVPGEGNSLIAFLIEARSYMKTATIDKRDGMNGIQNGGAHNEHDPVVVHCSPGTGRTGVAIACDIAIREFETTRLVDIPKIVYRIRRDRAAAVQTKEQYMFIYKVVSLYATKLTGGALENF